MATEYPMGMDESMYRKTIEIIAKDRGVPEEDVDVDKEGYITIKGKFGVQGKIKLEDMTKSKSRFEKIEKDGETYIKAKDVRDMFLEYKKINVEVNEASLEAFDHMINHMQEMRDELGKLVKKHAETDPIGL